ncbi:phage tail protein [Myxococcus sp. AM010]|uniref:phage tail protein n=1 Tax=Myxococcus sp. AM010 TaxID=2745138 RepID=UPI00159561D4|nr:phage tail protein [Myxococcus sp. AM010]NVJ14228.1 phage tail protein [Myxococcus sp. AM010]
MAGGGLKVGDVYVVVTAAVGEFSKSMRRVVADVAQTADKVGQLGSKIGEIGAIIGAGLYGALSAAAVFDSSVTDRMERIKLVFTNLGAEIGHAVLPHLERLSAGLERALGWFQRLEPSVTEGIGSFLFWGTAAGLAGGALSVAAGTVKQLAESFNAFVVPALGNAGKAVVRFSAFVGRETPVVEGNLKRVAKGADQVDARFTAAFRNAAARVLLVAAPLAAVALAVAGVVMLAGTLYKAWNDASTSMRDALVSAWRGVTEVAGRAVAFFRETFAGLGAVVGAWARGQLETFAFVVRNLARMAAPLARALNLDGVASSLEGLKDLNGDALLGGLKGFADGALGKLKDGFASVWADVSYGAGYAFDGVKLLGGDAAAFLREKFSGIFDDVLGGPKGKLRKPTSGPEIEAGRVQVGSFNAKEFLASVGNVAAVIEQVARKKAREFADALARAVDEAKRTLTSRFTQALGGLYELFERFEQGMTVGGVWGGVIAVVAELLAQSSTFATLIQMTAGFIQFVADALGRVLAPVLPLLASAFNMVAPLLDALVPVLETLLAPLQAIAPVLEVLGTLFQGLAPVITVLGQILVALTQPLSLLAGPIMKAFFAVMRVVAMGILYVVKGVGTVWNGIIGFIAGVFRALSKIPLVGGAFEKMARGLDSMKVPMDQVDGALNTLRNTTYESAAANSAAAVAQWENANATRKATEALTNVPSGIKVALARFNAQDPISGQSQGVHGASPVTSSPAVPVSGGNVSVGQIVIQAANDPAETVRQLYVEMKREAGRRRGNGEWLNGRY